MSNEITTTRKASALAVMANRLNIDPSKLHETLKNTVFKEANDHELVALVLVANEYGLNPLVKQIYAFPQKGGGIVPVVGIDGWLKIINARPEFDGLRTRYLIDDGKLIAVECTIYRKDRNHPTVVTEWLAECQRPTEPWKMMPHRMLRHKAIIQAGRIAFSITGLSDEDDAETIREASGRVVERSSSMVPDLSEKEPDDPTEIDLFGQPVKELPGPDEQLDELAAAFFIEKSELLKMATKKAGLNPDDKYAVIEWARGQLS
jgi:phage recombination protein Bet